MNLSVRAPSRFDERSEPEHSPAKSVFHYIDMKFYNQNEILLIALVGSRQPGLSF